MCTNEKSSTHDRTGITAVLLSLAKLLRARGLRVGVSHSTSSIEATNPATGGRDLDDRFPPQQLQQLVCIAPCGGVLWVWWLWPDSITGGFEREPLLPATKLEQAAEKIAHVVALAPAETGA